PDDRESAVFERPVFSGETPTSSHAGKFAILVGPAKQNEIVRAVVAGVSWVRLSVSNETDEFADVVEGETEFLLTGSSGAEILWRGDPEDSSSSEEGSSSEPEGDGTVWGLVRFSGGGSGMRIFFGRLLTSLPAATDPETGQTSGTARVLVRLGS